MKKIICIIIINLLLLSCDNTPIQSGSDSEKLKITFYTITNITTDSAIVSWNCSVKSEGFLTYSYSGGGSYLIPSLIQSETHFAQLTSLPKATKIDFTAFCKKEKTVNTFFTNFMTLDESAPTLAQRIRGIWIFGGVNSSGSAVSQVDLYDPDTDTWYVNISSLPTARAYLNAVSLNEKIYILGGLNTALNNPTSTVEEFDPSTYSWKSMSSMPQPLAGFVAGTVDKNIYVISGTITGSPSVSIAAPPANTIYQFTPGQGSSGTWSSYATSSTILSRADMGGCAINGTIFYNTGRNFSGVSQNTSSAYNPSSNTIVSGSISSFNTGRHGAGSACYRPISTDPYPNDSPSIIVVGGSTSTNLYYPPSSLALSNAFEVYTAGVSNSVTVGTNYPLSVYYPSVEFSYTKRTVYVFGGSTAINTATNAVYSLGMSSATGTWSQMSSMPLARFGHKAVIVNR